MVLRPKELDPDITYSTYKCEYYEVMAPINSCYFCQHCTDIWFDYTNGPYMFLCLKEADTQQGIQGKCEQFLLEVKGE